MAAKRPLAHRSGKQLGPAKAKEILRDKGFSRLGNGFDSPKQKRFIGWVAGGRKQRKSASRPK